MLKYLGFMVVILAMVATMGACKSSKAKIVIYPVQVDGEAPSFNADFIAYFPNEVQAHAGDEIKFTEVFSGEPHSVTFGKDVDAFMGVVKQMCPTGFSDPACANEYPPAASADAYKAANAKLPELITEELDVKQGAAQPCFLATESAPADGSACSTEQQKQPKDFDGTQTFYNSGWLQDQQVFSVKLSKDIAPGTYVYICLLHREGMTGTITVVDKATDVPTPDEVQQAGEQQRNDMVTKLQPAFDGLASLTADTAAAGAFSDDPNLEAGVDEFGPKELSIPVGGSVTWAIIGPHTVSFNAPEDARPLLMKGSDGSVTLNVKSIDPKNSPPAPTPDPNAPPPDENTPPTLIDAGEWDGQGFHSSGAFVNLDAAAYKVTFTQAGTYTYICLIHPDMEGTVTVQ